MRGYSFSSDICKAAAYIILFSSGATLRPACAVPIRRLKALTADATQTIETGKLCLHHNITGMATS